MTTVTKSFTWSMAHRLGAGYKGKCAHLHGHNYRAEFTFTSSMLDKYGMVLDFDEIKQTVQKWVMRNLDHATIVARHDKKLLEFLQVNKQKHYKLGINYENSTAECICALLARKVEALLTLVKVRVYETESCWAEFTK